MRCSSAYLLVFLITSVGFTLFSINVSATPARISITGLLLLTAINFRWALSQRMPAVSYLTSLDKYAILSLLFQFIFNCWHGIIGNQSTLFGQNTPTIINNNSAMPDADTCFLIAAMGFYVLFNIGYFLWFIYMTDRNNNRTKQF